MVSEGQTFYTWSPNHTRKKKKSLRSQSCPSSSSPCCLFYFLVQITVIQYALSYHFVLEALNGAVTSYVPDLFWNLWVIEASFLLLIMQIKCSLMEDNISLVTDSGLHNGWSIRRIEKADFQQREGFDRRLHAAIGRSGLIHTPAHTYGIILHVWHRERYAVSVHSSHQSAFRDQVVLYSHF